MLSQAELETDGSRLATFFCLPPTPPFGFALVITLHGHDRKKEPRLRKLSKSETFHCLVVPLYGTVWTGWTETDSILGIEPVLGQGQASSGGIEPVPGTRTASNVGLWSAAETAVSRRIARRVSQSQF